jgi:glycosyltransferase involved in cell wall biosynthesis
LSDSHLRIGIDARPLTHATSGIGRYTTEIVSRLARTRHELFLYAHQPFPCPCAANVHKRHGSLRKSRFASVFAQLRFPRWGRMDEIDIFWSPRHHLPLTTSVPAVVTIHDLVWRKAPESMIALGRVLERILMPPSVKKARAVIAVSDSTRRDLEDYLPAAASKITVIPEAPFQPLTPAPMETKRSNTILFVGTFEPRKNIPGILKAFARLVERGVTSHKLILAGNPGWKEDIPWLITHLGISDRVTIYERPEQAELEKLYAGCDFVVQPSFYEGFGLPILEAMTFGKPVITSDLSSMPEVAGNAALLVDPHSPESIADAMQRLISDNELYRTLAGRTRAQAAGFSWDRAAAQTLNVLEQVAAAAATN